MIEIIDNHSVRTDLLTGGPVLDAGCRGNRFGDWFRERGHDTWGLDPAPDSDAEHKYALVEPSQGWQVRLVMTKDKEARHVGPVGILVNSFSIGEFPIKLWDVVKLNIEGSEYGVLAQWPGPIARQIVCSFHEHTPQGQGEEKIAEIIKHMEQWYTVLQHTKEPRYGCHKNYWDTLMILRGLG